MPIVFHLNLKVNFFLLCGGIKGNKNDKTITFLFLGLVCF